MNLRTKNIAIFALTLSGLMMSIPVMGQIVINKSELPSKIGTTIISQYDTTENAVVNVGSPGENQIWNFTQPILGSEITSKVVALESTPYASDFPDGNWVIKYSGGLLDMIYSDIFPQIEGDVYFYQKVGSAHVSILGTGFVSPYLSGSAQFAPPNVILQNLPTQYLDSWITASIFSISKDTTIGGNKHVLALTVNDSAFSIIDAWGKVTIPLGTFDCLRMKSYVFMNEQITLDGVPIRTKKSRIINYNWLVKNLGLVVRVASHTGEQNDNFTIGRIFTRIERVVALPVELSSFDYKVKNNNVFLTWNTVTETNNMGFEIQRKDSKHGEFSKISFVKGFGSSEEPHLYKFVDTILEPGTYYYRLKQINLDGTFEYSKTLEVVTTTPKYIELHQNYPNPFNPITAINYELPQSGHITLEVFNLNGEKIKVLKNAVQTAGTHHAIWDGTNNYGQSVSSGIYICHMEFSGTSDVSGKKYFVKNKKMILAR